MLDIATELKERFDLAVIWFFERCELMHGLEATLPEKDAHAVEILKNLRDSVDEIPPSLLNETGHLRNSDPDLFERTLVWGVQVVGFGFYPANATDFVEVFKRTVQRAMACA